MAAGTPRGGQDIRQIMASGYKQPGIGGVSIDVTPKRRMDECLDCGQERQRMPQAARRLRKF